MKQTDATQIMEAPDTETVGNTDGHGQHRIIFGKLMVKGVQCCPDHVRARYSHD